MQGGLSPQRHRVIISSLWSTWRLRAQRKQLSPHSALDCLSQQMPLPSPLAVFSVRSPITNRSGSRNAPEEHSGQGRSPKLPPAGDLLRLFLNLLARSRQTDSINISLLNVKCLKHVWTRVLLVLDGFGDFGSRGDRKCQLFLFTNVFYCGVNKLSVWSRWRTGWLVSDQGFWDGSETVLRWFWDSSEMVLTTLLTWEWLSASLRHRRTASFVWAASEDQ